jgi:hypothetical protein
MDYINFYIETAFEHPRQMLYAVIKKGYKQIVTKLIDTIDITDFELKLALDSCQYEIASLLLTRLGRVTHFSYHPRRDDVEYIKFLVENNISIGRMITNILLNGFYNIVKYLVANNLGAIHLSDVKMAAYKGHFDIIKYLIEDGGYDLDLSQLLLSAVTSDNVQLVRYLIDKGVDVSKHNYIRQTSNNDILRLLIETGSRDYTDRTMEKAIDAINLEAVELLLRQEGYCSSGYMLEQVKKYHKNDPVRKLFIQYLPKSF